MTISDILSLINFRNIFFIKERKEMEIMLNRLEKQARLLDQVDKSEKFFAEVDRKHCQFALNNPKHKTVERQFLASDHSKISKHLKLRTLRYKREEAAESYRWAKDFSEKHGILITTGDRTIKPRGTE